MPFDAVYAERLRLSVERWLRQPGPLGEGDETASVELLEADGRYHLSMKAAGKSLEAAIDDEVYHVQPDGTDVEEHAEWLAQGFNEDAR